MQIINFGRKVGLGVGRYRDESRTGERGTAICACVSNENELGCQHSHGNHSFKLWG